MSLFPHPLPPGFLDEFRRLWTCDGVLPTELDLGLPPVDFARNDYAIFIEDRPPLPLTRPDEWTNP